MMPSEDDKRMVNRCIDKFNQAINHDFVTHTAFLDLYQQGLISSQSKVFQQIIWTLTGGYVEAERKMLVFIPENYKTLAIETLVPIDVLRITSYDLDEKKLSHRDYLGAVMNLGIKRERIGDILVDEKGALLFCDQDMTQFLVEQLTLVKHSHVSVSKLDGPIEDIRKKYEMIKSTVASCRLDSIVKAAINVSRGNAATLIKMGRVAVDGRIRENIDFMMNEGQVLSVRQFGKYKLVEASTRSKKDRIIVVFHKYA